MNKKIKKIIVIIMTFLLIFTGVVKGKNAANRQTPNFISKGNALMKTSSDGITNVPTYEDLNSGAGGFTKPEGNGRIWVDKSVVDQKDGSFEVDLSVLTQEYISSVSTTSETMPAADVVFVLDGSGSMATPSGTDVPDIDNNGVKIQRLKAMIDATNEAIKIIMDANPKNRIAVYVYSGLKVHNVLPLDSYSIKPNAQFPNSYLVVGDEYMNVTNPIWQHKLVYLNKDLLDGNNKDFDNFMNANGVSGNSFMVDGGTATQAGIVSGTYGLSQKISTSSNVGERIPFTFLLSDGAATYGQDKWWNNKTVIDTPNSLGNGSEYKPAGQTKEPQLEDITANLILSAAKMRDELTKSYKEYNQKFGYSWGTKNELTSFYTVGLGSDINGPYTKDADNNLTQYYKCAWMGLNPSSIEKVLAGEKVYSKWSDADLLVAQAAAREVKSKINTYFQAAPNDVKDVKDYTNPDNYSFANYYTYAESYGALNDAFNQLAKDVANETKEIKSPVVEQIIGSTRSSIHFKDVIGDGFTIDETAGLNVVYNGKTVIQLKRDTNGDYVDQTGKITGKVVLSQEGNSQILEWHVSAEDMKKSLIQILDFDQTNNLTDDEIQEIMLNKKLNLKYQVKLDDDILNSPNATFYTNAYAGGNKGTTIVTYQPTHDNSYYYHTNKKVGITGNLSFVGYGSGADESDDITHFVKGEKINTVIANTLYKNVYITTDMVQEDMKNEQSIRKLSANDIGSVQDVTSDGTDTDFNTRLAKSLMNCKQAKIDDVNNTTDEIFAYHSGIQKVHNHTVSKSGQNFDNNHTNTASLVSQESFVDGTVKMELGNNGRVDIVGKINKTGSATVTPGGTISYTITVENPLNKKASNLIVEDDIPAGLIDITTSTTSGVSITGNKVEWSIAEIAANSSLTLTIEAKVPNSSVEARFENSAKLTVVENITLTTPAVSDTVGTKVIRDINISVEKNDVPWVDHGKTYQLQNGAIYYSLDDPIPDGTYQIVEEVKNGVYKDTSKTIVVANGVGNQVVDYYTVVVEHDVNISSVSELGGLGTLIDTTGDTKTYLFVSGDQIKVKPLIKKGYEFEKWTYNTASAGNEENDHTLTVTIDREQTIIATSKKQNSQVDIVSSLDDGGAWDKFGNQLLELVDAAGNKITDFNNVPDGKYTLLINGQNTQYTLDVDATKATEYDIVVKYYSLTLVRNSSTNSEYIPNFEGSGVYLAGSTVHMHANVDHSKAHFVSWTITEGVNSVIEAGKGNVECSNITINAKTTVEAKAETPPQSSVPLIITVNKDGALWNEHVNQLVVKYVSGNSETVVTDKGNLTDVGDYKIYDGRKVVGTFNVSAADILNGTTKRTTIDYYTLLLHNGTGIDSVSGSGIYLEGEKATINATIHNQYYFNGWTGTNTYPNVSHEITMDKKVELTANAKPYNALNINVKLDGQNYANYPGTVVVKDKAGNEYSDLTQLKDKVYEVYVHSAGVQEIKVDEINLSNGDTKVFDVNYYTLLLTKTTGINTVSGAGIYLTGTQVDILATVNDSYSFANWTGSTTLTQNANKLTIDRPLQYTAHATQTKFAVTINVNKDDEEYVDFNKIITLKDKNNNIITDLTKVPNGIYEVQVDGTDTYLQVEVKNGNVEGTLDYYTLTLNKGTGIKDVNGSGIYLKGTQVKIDASLEEQYCFENWAGSFTLSQSKADITVNEKTTLTANAEKINEVVVDVRLDDAVYQGFNKDITLKDKDGKTITDLTKVPNGEYTVYVDGKETYLTVNVDGKGKNIVLDYYTLTLKSGTGINEVDGSGIYLKGTQVKINAGLKDQYHFENWTGSLTLSQAKAEVVMNGEMTLTANAKIIKNAYNVDILVKKDNETWDNHNKDIILKDKDGNTVTDLTQVNDGTYTIWVDNVSTGQKVTVKGNDTQFVLDYFTVVLDKGMGIDEVTGAGVYLANTTIRIDASLLNGYIFKGWSGYLTFDKPSQTLVVRKTMHLKAEAFMKSGIVRTDRPMTSDDVQTMGYAIMFGLSSLLLGYAIRKYFLSK